MKVVCRLFTLMGIVVATLWATPPASAGVGTEARHDKARTIWMNGYLKIEEAGRAEQQNNNVLALKLFEEALAQFKAVQVQFSDWNPSLLEYRINFCRDRIRALQTAVAANEESMSKPELVMLVRELRQQQDRHDKKIIAAEEAAAKHQQALAEARQQLSAVQTELQQRQQSHTELEAAIAALRAEIEAKAAAAEQLQQRLSTAEANAQKAVAAREHLTGLRQNLDADLKAKQRQLDKTAAEIATLRQNLERAEQKALAAQSETDQTSKTLQAKINQLSEALEREQRATRDLEALLKNKENESKGWREAGASLEQQVQQANAAQQQLLTDNKALTDQLANSRKHRDSLQAQLTELTGKLDSTQQTNSDAAAALAKLQDELKQRDATVRDLNKIVNDRMAQLRDLQAALVKAETAAASANATAAKLDAELVAERQQVKQLSKSGASLTSELESTAAKLVAAERLAVELKQLDRVRSDDLHKVKNELAAQQQEKAQLTQLLAQFDAGKLQELQQTVAALTDKLTAAETAEQTMAAKLAVLSKTTADFEAQDTQRREQELRRETEKREQLRKIHGLLAAATQAETANDQEAAIWQYKQVLEAEPTNVIAMKRLGLLLAKRGNDVEATDYLRQAFAADPDDPEVLLPLGFALVQQEKADMAVSMLTRAVAIAPDNADYHRFLGVACRSLGWNNAAESAFKRSFRLDENSMETAFNLAALLATMDNPRYDEARTWYNKAKQLGAQPDPGLETVLKEK